MSDNSLPCSLGLSIAVSGLPGSGKTTLAKLLAKELGLRYVSLGSIFRGIAKDMGVSIEELSLIAERNPEIDRLIDERAREEARKGCVVVDGHISAWILKDLAHLRIIVTAPLKVRVERIASRDSKPLNEAEREVRIREESERRRYKALYNIDVDNLSDADLVINTEKFDVEEVVRIALTAVDLIINKLIKKKA